MRYVAAIFWRVRRYAGLDDTQLGIELSADYVALARHRIADEAAIGNVEPDAAPAEVQGAFRDL